MSSSSHEDPQTHPTAAPEEDAPEIVPGETPEQHADGRDEPDAVDPDVPVNRPAGPA